MAKAKSLLSKPLIMILGRIVAAFAGKSLQDIDVSEACEIAGVSATGQKKLTGWLKECRETISSHPAELLATAAKTLPESVTLSLLAVAQTYNAARFEAVYNEETDAKAKLQQAIIEKDRCEALTNEQVAAVKKKFEHLEGNVSLLWVHNTELDNKVRELEIEKAVLAGRLEERTLQEANRTASTTVAEPENAVSPEVAVDGVAAATTPAETNETSDVTACNETASPAEPHVATPSEPTDVEPATPASEQSNKDNVDGDEKPDTLGNGAPEQKNQKAASPKQSKPVKGGTPSNSAKSEGAKKPGKSAGQSKQA